MDQTIRSPVAKALLPDPDRLLKHGLLVSVELLKNPRDVVAIPEEALIPTNHWNNYYSRIAQARANDFIRYIRHKACVGLGERGRNADYPAH
jgi:hypothetical protein